MPVDEYRFYKGAVSAICRNLSLEVALQECLVYLRPYIPADLIQFVYYDGGLEAIRILATATEKEAKRRDGIIPLDDFGRKYLHGTSSLTTFIIDTDEKEDSIAPILCRLENLWPAHSGMVTHLMVGGMRPGNLVLFAEGKRCFTEKHRRLFELLNEPLTIALSNIMQYEELNRLKDIMADDLQYFHKKLRHSTADENVIGEKMGLRGVMELVRDVAPLDSPVLLLGETGSGKEIVANSVHAMSRRKNGPFIKVNCGAIPDTLMDSELFGHEKGAFTGADARKRGCFERACGGTIFLDEVAELPLQAQVRMLRVLQEKKIVRVGGVEEIDVDIRIIAATHQNLVDMVAQKRFRTDLHYRLNVFPIIIPPLRNRLEDIPALVNHFIDKKTIELQIVHPPKVAPGAVDALFAYGWPGNVRELENVVERAMILNKEGPLSFNEIVWGEAGSMRNVSGGCPEEFPTLDFINARHIREALKATKGRVYGPRGAAELLGINSSTLRHRMRKLGLSAGKKSKGGKANRL